MQIQVGMAVDAEFLGKRERCGKIATITKTQRVKTDLGVNFRFVPGDNVWITQKGQRLVSAQSEELLNAA
jgi:hypothetical protein